ncbi:sporulation protein [Paenibacillus sp. IB182496]|uniref:Sporulation protein n=1 Tax=Paenibacillus sabuli TaxID=2772509 RepID=A0A927BUY4_9BACL|nr:nucleoside recognition domain-containing protein [Paenibacillus sabuli]MBD2846130.1 sporulation protein [Paenibacillus sabuli]
MTRTLIFAAASLWLVSAIIRYPDEAFHSALQGLEIWWNIVFPGLLPFLVLAELMLAFGVMHMLGALLEPACRRLLGLPGPAGWALALGWSGGFSAGAEAVASLRQREWLSRGEAQRLLSTAHMTNPMVMLIVVGAGFLHQPLLGLYLALIVWLAALLGAWLGRLADRAGGGSGDTRRLRTARPAWLGGAMQALADGRAEDGRGLGKALGDAVATGVQKLMLAGGMIIVCALAIRLLRLDLPNPLAPVSFAGLYELHLGAYAVIDRLAGASPELLLGATAAVLAWGGWSNLLQAHSAVAHTDLRLAPLLRAKLGHAALAFGAAYVLWRPFRAAADAFGLSPQTHVFGDREAGSSWLRTWPAGIDATDMPSLWPLLPHALLAFALLLLLLGSSSILRIRRR